MLWEFCPDTGIGHSNDAFLGFGITVHSGVWGTLGRIVKRGKPISRKEKRALILAGCMLLVYIIMIIGTTFAPWTMLRSVTGSLTNSPFQKGFIISFRLVWDYRVWLSAMHRDVFGMIRI